jgi:hypothetical protein
LWQAREAIRSSWKVLPQRQHPMGELPMTAFAGRGQLPLRRAPPDLDLPLACGYLPAFTALPHAARSS